VQRLLKRSHQNRNLKQSLPKRIHESDKEHKAKAHANALALPQQEIKVEVQEGHLEAENEKINPLLRIIRGRSIWSGLF
jgi:hypothetical protein